MKSATKKTLKLTSLLLLLATNYYLFTNFVKAQSVDGLSAIPPRLEVTVKPDGTSTQIIKVRNESNLEKNIAVSVEDFVVNDDKGTPTIVSSTETDNRWAASNWIQISPSSFKLKGGETKSLVLTIMPPKNALPGGHYAMVIHSPDDQVSLFNSTGASIQTKVGTLVYITIPGNIRQNAIVKDFTVPKFSEFGPIDLKTTIQNLSDIHIRPAGSITITNMFGLKTTYLQFNPDGVNIFPGKIRDFENQLNKKWLFGRYKAELNAAYGTAGGVATAAIFFWVIPWRLLILIAVAITVITFILLSLKKKKNNKKEDGTQEKVDELEKELESLKKKYKDQ
jgi:hypothetical protein